VHFIRKRPKEEVAANIGKVTATEPARSVTLCEAFPAGCQAKADEFDDSRGSFGQFAQDLISLWIKAGQASSADPHQTAATLLAWIDDDPYGFFYQIEKAAAAAFDKAGLTAFESRFGRASRPSHRESNPVTLTNSGATYCVRSTRPKGMSRHTSRSPSRPGSLRRTAWPSANWLLHGGRVRHWRGSTAGYPSTERAMSGLRPHTTSTAFSVSY
jgi:hypothetical protein